MKLGRGEKVKLLVEVASRRARGDSNSKIALDLGLSERTVYRLQQDIRRGQFPELDAVAQAVLAEYKDARLETTRSRMLARLSDRAFLQAEKSFGIYQRPRRRWRRAA